MVGRPSFPFQALFSGLWLLVLESLIIKHVSFRGLCYNNTATTKRIKGLSFLLTPHRAIGNIYLHFPLNAAVFHLMSATNLYILRIWDTIPYQIERCCRCFCLITKFLAMGHVTNKYQYTLRIQVCPKEGISPIILFWGWDWNPQTYSREVSGFLGIYHYISLIDSFSLTFLSIEENMSHLKCHKMGPLLVTSHNMELWGGPL